MEDDPKNPFGLGQEGGFAPFGRTLAAHGPTARAPMEHELKTWQSYFNAVTDGTKTFEIRRDDRGFRVGDTLRLRETEYGSGAYTGREERRLITHILRHEADLGLADGFAILSLRPFTPHPTGSQELGIIYMSPFAHD